jgi:hypothetical protein
MTLLREVRAELSAKKLLVALWSESSSAIRMLSALQSLSDFKVVGSAKSTHPGRPYWPESRTPDPLIKSQSQSRPEPNIDKKAQPFRSPLAVYFGNERCLFCPGSGTKRAQPRMQGIKDRPSSADINVATDRSVHSIVRFQSIKPWRSKTFERILPGCQPFQFLRSSSLN